MKLALRLVRCWALTTAAVAAASGCNGPGSQSSPTGVLPVPPTTQTGFTHRFRALDAVKAGIYASSYRGTSVIGFKRGYRHGRGPNCLEYLGWNRHVNDIATDPQGNLIVPESAQPHNVIVYSGPGMCGPKLGTFRDPYGQPAGAASFNAARGTILLADIAGPRRRQVANIAVCTLNGGCTKRLENPNNAGLGGGVALAKNGDCWLTSFERDAYTVAMTYWPGCKGHGEAATGFQGSSTGSLSIDKDGNLVSVDWAGGSAGQLWVYSGCNPACTLVGGPFPLQGFPVFGAFDATGDRFGVIEEGTVGIVDIYKYTPTQITYEYSFDTGIATTDPEGFAFSPAFDQ